jgi:hypothetical protein
MLKSVNDYSMEKQSKDDSFNPIDGSLNLMMRFNDL